MSSKKPEKTVGKPAGKKLRLNKETLKDLTEPQGSVKGGARACSGDTTGCGTHCGPTGMGCSV
jgi:hypothetical protein